MANKKINLEDFKSIIREEASKLKRKNILESKRVSLELELKLIKESIENEEQVNEFFSGKFGKAKNDWKATHKDEIDRLTKAYKSYDDSYIEISKSLLEKSKKETSALAKKYGISGQDIKVLYKDLNTIAQPMDFNTFKNQAEKGGVGMSDIAKGASSGRKSWTSESKKPELTMSEFREIVKEEAMKLKKRMVLENERKSLQSELKSIVSESFSEEFSDDMEIEEGLGSWAAKKLNLKDSDEEVQARKDKMLSNLESAKSKGYKKFQLDGNQVDEAAMISGMEKNGFSGRFIPIPKAGVLAYKSGSYGASRLGTGGSSQGLGV